MQRHDLEPFHKHLNILDAAYRNITAIENIIKSELYLNLENIYHTKTKTKSPQTNGICERFHKTILSEFYQIVFQKKIYESIEMLQNDLDEWLRKYSESRPYSSKYCYGKTSMQIFLNSPCLLQKRKCCSMVTTFQTKRKYDRSSDDAITSTSMFVQKNLFNEDFSNNH